MPHPPAIDTPAVRDSAIKWQRIHARVSKRVVTLRDGKIIGLTGTVARSGVSTKTGIKPKLSPLKVKKVDDSN